jgi:hypothetical protein
VYDEDNLESPNSSLSLPETDAVSDSDDVRNQSTNSKIFYSCGYAGWLRVREAWRQSENDGKIRELATTTTTTEKHGKAIKAKDSVVELKRSIPPTVKRDLVKCLQERRHFELSRSIPLRDMVEAYCVAWESEMDEKPL